ncbi:hypothetical protein KIL84_004273 [Mauremys mutica]|uniref:Uncharacterized protein n=1 Tax=Mauremys mutica TaxID=74926 RepID=A0A9D3XNM6_9SAUR|nr:hypothetical protein KIL84_004273 [Mauremys mutica]
MGGGGVTLAPPSGEPGFPIPGSQPEANPYLGILRSPSPMLCLQTGPVDRLIKGGGAGPGESGAAPGASCHQEETGVRCCVVSLTLGRLLAKSSLHPSISNYYSTPGQAVSARGLALTIPAFPGGPDARLGSLSECPALTCQLICHGQEALCGGSPQAVWTHSDAKDKGTGTTVPLISQE